MARYDTKRVPAVNQAGEDDFYILFRAHYHETRVVEAKGGKVFVRRADEKVELKTDQQRRQLRIDKGEVQFEQEMCNLHFPVDFDVELVRQFTSNVRKIRGIDPQTADERIMAALRLGKLSDGAFQPNIACGILFAKDPVSVIPGCKIHFLRYEGSDAKGGEKFNETANMPPLEGPLPRQYRENKLDIGLSDKTILRIRIGRKIPHNSRISTGGVA